MFDNNKKIENQMTEWLSHPNEFGVAPKSIHHKRTYKVDLVTYGNVEVHLVEYVMPDGFKGRGFVNGSLTWSFLGNDINAIDDSNLLLAYCGWAWLFPAIQADNVKTQFTSDGEEARLIAQKKLQGFDDFQITNRYKIGTSELFEFRAKFYGKSIKGAGDTNAEVKFKADEPCFNLPSIYFFLGRQVIKSIK